MTTAQGNHNNSCDQQKVVNQRDLNAEIEAYRESVRNQSEAVRSFYSGRFEMGLGANQASA